jgi:hypothetical protein
MPTRNLTQENQDQEVLERPLLAWKQDYSV